MQFRAREILYPSNLLSLSRVVLVVPAAYLMRQPVGTADAAIVVLVAVASFTDYLDGMLARRLGHVGDLGRVLDPLADKVAMAIVGVALILYRGFPLPVVVLLVYRDVLIVAGSALLARRTDAPPEANIWGKLNTIVCGLAAVAFLAAPESIAATILLAACYGLILVSGIVYYRLMETRLASAGAKWGARVLVVAVTGAVVWGVSRWPFF